MLNYDDLPTDPSEIGQDTIDLIDESGETAANAGVILGQLDPTEIDHKTGLPKWNEGQRELIVRFNDKLSDWKDE